MSEAQGHKGSGANGTPWVQVLVKGGKHSTHNNTLGRGAPVEGRQLPPPTASATSSNRLPHASGAASAAPSRLMHP